MSGAVPATKVIARGMRMLSTKGYGRALARDDDSNYDEWNEKAKKWVEKFDESTYNKRIGKFCPNTGDKNIVSDTVIEIVRESGDIVQESTKFLDRLYGAESGNVWYRPEGSDD